MPVTLRATSTGANNNAVSTTINLPAGTALGDVTVVGFVKQAAYADAAPQSVTTPAGWSVICNANGQGVIYRLFQSADPTTITLTAAASGWWNSVAASYIGCDATTPVDAYNSCLFTEIATGGGGTITPLHLAPSINPNFQSDLLVAIYGTSYITSVSAPTLPPGFTSRIAALGGPSVVLCDKQLDTTNTPTGSQTVTWPPPPGNVGWGAQIALRTAGAASVTPATPRTTWGAWLNIPSGASVSSLTVPLSKTNPQPSDLVALFVAASGAISSPPAGYTQTATIGGSCYLYTRVRQAGDADPVLTASSAIYFLVEAFCLRKSGAGGINPVIDQAVTAPGTGGASPWSAAAPSLSPANASEYLLAGWLSAANTAGAFTAPAGLTTQVSNAYAPSVLIADILPAATPTGTFTATYSGGAVAQFGAIEMLVSVQALTGGAGAAQARALVLA